MFFLVFFLLRKDGDVKVGTSGHPARDMYFEDNLLKYSKVLCLFTLTLHFTWYFTSSFISQHSLKSISSKKPFFHDKELHSFCENNNFHSTD